VQTLSIEQQQDISERLFNRILRRSSFSGRLTRTPIQVLNLIREYDTPDTSGTTRIHLKRLPLHLTDDRAARHQSGLRCT
jgi:hypothetical protein